MTQAYIFIERKVQAKYVWWQIGDVLVIGHSFRLLLFWVSQFVCGQVLRENYMFIRHTVCAKYVWWQIGGVLMVGHSFRLILVWFSQLMCGQVLRKSEAEVNDF